MGGINLNCTDQGASNLVSGGTFTLYTNAKLDGTGDYAPYLEFASALGPDMAYYVGTDGEFRIAEAYSANSMATFDVDTTAGNTRMLLWDVDNGVLARVSVGADDSGGTGYKVLRIPN